VGRGWTVECRGGEVSAEEAGTLNAGMKARLEDDHLNLPRCGRGGWDYFLTRVVEGTERISCLAPQHLG
jgi:hypothetical protein